MTEQNGVERSSATEILRRLLDERGVEWWQSANTLGCVFTRWYSPLFGDEVCAMENGEEGLVLFDHFVTPEQAIAATLGRGTCHVKAAKKIGDSFGFSLSCGHSMVNPFNDHPDYCPWCGAKVVDE